MAVCLARSAIGLELRAVGLNETASRRAGLPVERLVIGALAASGGLAGLAGAIMIQGDQHYLTSGFSSGFGFDGLVVGLLARGSAPAVVAVRAAVRMPALGRHVDGDERAGAVGDRRRVPGRDGRGDRDRGGARRGGSGA